MSSSYGNHLRVSIFGQSHSEAIGAVVDGLPAGEAIDLEEVRRFMRRRAPGQNAHSTARKEADEPRVVSGLSLIHIAAEPHFRGTAAIQFEGRLRAIEHKHLLQLLQGHPLGIAVLPPIRHHDDVVQRAQLANGRARFAPRIPGGNHGEIHGELHQRAVPHQLGAKLKGLQRALFHQLRAQLLGIFALARCV